MIQVNWTKQFVTTVKERCLKYMMAFVSFISFSSYDVLANQCSDILSTSLKIITESAGNVSHTSANLSGYVSGGANVNAWFVYKREDSNLGSCANYNRASSGNFHVGDRSYTTINGLQGESTYYYKFCARSGDEFADGGIKSFVTQPEINLDLNLNCGEGEFGGSQQTGIRVNISQFSYAHILFRVYRGSGVPTSIDVWGGRYSQPHGPKEFIGSSGFLLGADWEYTSGLNSYDYLDIVTSSSNNDNVLVWFLDTECW